MGGNVWTFGEAAREEGERRRRGLAWPVATEQLTKQDCSRETKEREKKRGERERGERVAAALPLLRQGNNYSISVEVARIVCYSVSRPLTARYARMT